MGHSVSSVLSARLLVAALSLSAVALASAQGAAPPESAQTKAANPDPELIALTWQVRRQANAERIKQPVWRPDGTRLTDEETIALLDQVKSFQNHWWQPDQLRPLVMVFRRGGAIKSGLSTAIVLADGRRLWSGRWGPFQPDRLTKSASAPTIRELSKWPEWVDLDVKVPLEDPQIIKTLDEGPSSPVDVAPGVRWHIDPDRGIDFKRGKERRDHLTAAVLELENESADSLVVYDSTVWLRGQERPLPGAYATIVVTDGVRRTIRVSDPLDDVQAIERVEFTRQRFKIERLAHIRLRLDLMPPPDTDDPKER